MGECVINFVAILFNWLIVQIFFLPVFMKVIYHHEKFFLISNVPIASVIIYRQNLNVLTRVLKPIDVVQELFLFPLFSVLRRTVQIFPCLKEWTSDDHLFITSITFTLPAFICSQLFDNFMQLIFFNSYKVISSSICQFFSLLM